MKEEDEPRITGFQLYQFDDPRDLPYGSCVKEGYDCRYGVLLVCCSGRIGWGEILLTENQKYFDLAQWASFLQAFRQPTLLEAYATLDKNREYWGATKSALVRTALDDLRCRLGGEVPVRPAKDADALFELCRAHYVIV
jgi:hypothetical protein